MVNIITRSKTNTSDFHTMTVDQLHDKRKKTEEQMRDGIFTKDQMDMRDCQDEDQEVKRVEQYDSWKGKNESNMKDWGSINREFKERGEEGRVHCLDDIRNKKQVKYD